MNCLIKRNKVLLLKSLSPIGIVIGLFYKKVYIINKGYYTLRLHNFPFFLKFIDIFNIEFVKGSEFFEDYPTIDAISREEFSKIAYEYKSSFKERIGDFLGEEGSVSFYIKFLAHNASGASFYKSIFILKKKYNLSDSDLNVLSETEISRMIGIEAIFCSRMFKKLRAQIIRLKIKIILLKMRYKFAKVREKNNENVFFISSEVSNPRYMTGKFGEPDYLCEDDVPCLFYRTSQGNMDVVDDNDFSSIDFFVDLRNVGISRKTYKEFSELSNAFLDEIDIELYSLIKVFFRSYSEYEFLFSNYKILNNVFLPFSNDKRYVRLDSAIATKVANKYGAKNISYQTRAPHLYDYTFYYDVFDVFFAWSEFWFQKPFMYKGLSSIQYIGLDCHLSRNTSNKNIVSVFLSDITTNTLNTREYNLNLLRIVEFLAEKHPEILFKIKVKFEDQFYSSFPKLCFNKNVEVVSGLYDVESLIISSSIVLSLAYTSPGIFSVMNNIPTIVYSELIGIKHEISNLDFVRYSKESVINRFDEIISSKHSPSDVSRLLNTNNSCSHKLSILRSI